MITLELPPQDLSKKQLVQLALFLVDGDPSQGELAEIADCDRSYPSHIKEDFNNDDLDIDNLLADSNQQILHDIVRALKEKGYGIHEDRAQQLDIDYPLKTNSGASREDREEWYLELSATTRKLNLATTQFDELKEHFPESDDYHQKDFINMMDEVQQCIENQKASLKDLSEDIAPDT